MPGFRTFSVWLKLLPARAASGQSVYSTDARATEEPGFPAGVALAEHLVEAYDQAYATDPSSTFGGIIAFNRALNGATAAAIVTLLSLGQLASLMTAGELCIGTVT